MNNTLQYANYYPNSASHDLRYSINNDLIFDKLSAGSYTYYVKVYAENGNQKTEKVAIQSTFTVQGTTTAETAQKPNISISGLNTPGTLNKGDNFGIRGTVSVDCGKITQVYGAILNSSGNVVQYGRYYPNAASHDLRYSINNDLIFDDLPRGSYTYVVKVKAADTGVTTERNVIVSNFTVK